MSKPMKKPPEDRMLATVINGKIYRFIPPRRPAPCGCGLCGNKWRTPCGPRTRKNVTLGVWVAVPERMP